MKSLKPFLIQVGKRSLCLLVAFVFLCAPPSVHAFLPNGEFDLPNLGAKKKKLPPELVEIRMRKLGDIFTDVKARRLITSKQRQEMKKDVEMLIRGYRGDEFDDEVDGDFIRNQLWPVIDGLSPSSIQQPPPLYEDQRPLINFTVDEFIAWQLWTYWVRNEPDVRHDPQLIYKMVDKHRSLSDRRRVMVLVLGGAIGGFALRTLWTMILTGPGADIIRVVVDPLQNRASSWILARLGRKRAEFSAWLNQKKVTETVVRHGDTIPMGFQSLHWTHYGMPTAEVQQRMFNKLLSLLSKFESTYGSVVGNDLHVGRAHLEVAIYGEYNTSVGVQLMKVAATTLYSRAESILHNAFSNLRTKAIMQKRPVAELDAKLHELETDFKQFMKLFEIRSLEEVTTHKARLRLQKARELAKKLEASGGFSREQLDTIHGIGLDLQKARITEGGMLAIRTLMEFIRPELDRVAPEDVRRLIIVMRAFSMVREEYAELSPIVLEIVRMMGFDASVAWSAVATDQPDFWSCMEEQLRDGDIQKLPSEEDKPDGKSCSIFARWWNKRRKKANPLESVPPVNVVQTQDEVVETPEEKEDKRQKKVADLTKDILENPDNALYFWVQMQMDLKIRERFARILAERAIAQNLSPKQLEALFHTSTLACVDKIKTPEIPNLFPDDSPPPDSPLQ